MTNIRTLLLVALCAGGVLGGPRGKPYYDLARAGEYFEHFIEDYGRQYGSEQEKQRRLAIFTEYLAVVNERNEKDTAFHGITIFADMEEEEKERYFGHQKDAFSGCDSFDMTTLQVNNTLSDDSWDWRAQNAVTAVKNQKRCGSCWAFSTIGNIEGQLAIKHNTLIQLSEQELLECDQKDHGCQGGNVPRAFSALQGIGGVMSEADYPYAPNEIKSCRYSQDKSKVKVTGCTSFLDGLTEENLKGILKQTGPISIAINSKALHSYTGGIMEDCNGDKNNHAVLLVGYGNENGTPFWIVKNSWGTRWGEDGYYRVKMGINGCGMLNQMVASAIVG